MYIQNKNPGTKMPSNDEYLLSRPRINQMLSEAMRFPLVTIVAGTGYGKTLAVSEYTKYTNSTVLWYHLTELDNIPSRFWENIVSIIRPYNALLSQQLGSLGFPDTLEKTNLFLHAIAKEIYKKEHLIFILDDFHHINEGSIKTLIENFVYANIENLSVILCTRYEISMNFSGMFDNNLIYRITDEQLKFTNQEISNYFKQQGITFPPETMNQIQTSTEGWPLAIYLIGLHSKEQGMVYDNPVEYTIPVIFDLIEKQMFADYDLSIQQLLVKLSLLGSFPPAILSLLYKRDLTSMLDLLNKNMFIRDNHFIHKYNFHYLYIEFLKTKLSLLDPEDIDKTYLTAAKWYDDYNFKMDAISYYRKCKNYEAIWRIIDDYPPKDTPQETAVLFLELIDEFPDELINLFPLIKITQSHLYMLLNDYVASEKIADEIIQSYESASEPDCDLTILGEAYLTKASLSITNRTYDFVDYYKKAYPLLPDGSRRYKKGVLSIDSNNALTLHSPASGELERMVKAFFEAAPYATKLMHGISSGREYLTAAEGYYFQGDLNSSIENIFHSIYSAKDNLQHDIVCNGYFLLMRIHIATGNYKDVLAYQDLMNSYFTDRQELQYMSIPDIANSWFYIKIGHPEKVPNWITDDALNTRAKPIICAGRAQTIKAQYLLLKKEYERLGEMLGQMEQICLKNGLWFSLIKTQILATFYHFGQNDLIQAITAFQTAYEMSHANNIVMPFAEFGSDMCTFITALKDIDYHKIPDNWLNTIFTKASTYAKRLAYITAEFNKNFSPDKAQYKNLTPREQQMLKCLAQGQTREEIADIFHVSLNTVKTVLKNIYSKLGAINRIDAVQIATQSKIIDS